jgi:sigma-B regulation protein RsbU (phosphoserine phosphatase)
VKAIVIDDAPDIRIYVRALLRRWGYETEDASEGLEGLSRIKASDIRIVVCDWMMPGMSGPDLCRAIREAELGRYVYVILLTGRSDKADLLEGLNAGADDFLTKPLDAQVLQARLRVGERILSLEQRLAEQNRELMDSRNRLEHAYGQIQADLATAARIQVQMLPTSDRVVSPIRAEWLFLPASQVSGDSFNFFELTTDVIGFYHLDVSGHGIPAALLSASLSRSLTPGGGPGVAAHRDFLDPARFLANLNRQLSDPERELENFATIAYGTLDRTTGEAEIALAGHPRPMILHADGNIEYLKAGGLPVGMFPDVGYESQRVHLGPGDRLILYSDGVTECQNPHGELFGDEQMQAVTAAATRVPSPGLTAALSDSLRAWRGRGEFEDDISVLVLERPLESNGEPNPELLPGESR